MNTPVKRPTDLSAHRPAFTLIELLVVMAIIGILLGMIFPAVQMIREGARRTDCTNRLRQIATGLLNHESARQRFPAGITGGSAIPHPRTTWLVQILPYIEQTNVWERTLSDYQWSPNPFSGHLGLQTVIGSYQCPSDPDSGVAHWTHEGYLVATTNYLGVNGTNYQTRDGVFYLDSATRTRDIGDGQSNTLMVGERPPSPDFWFGWWYAGNGIDGTGAVDMNLGVRELNGMAPGNYLDSCPPGPYQFQAGRQGRQCDALHFWSYHSGGGNFALCDGSVKFIPYSANEVMPQLATRSGGEAFKLPWE